MPDSIAHYRLGEKLGQGGMGEVYRATDTKLGRDVAVKLIAPNLSQDAARMASFTREAQVLASLNHPNIAAIYGVEDDAIVMELVEGPTLEARIKQGPIPLDEALPIARQIADALASAHEKGIVHRDLKPANIKVTPEGTVKLLDFGLAKAAAAAAIVPDDAVTIAMSMASAGMIVGTPGYMAPEQARGQPVDKRVDIWAFGVVLYEMLTGGPLFRGETMTDVMAAVVREEPDLSRVPAAVRPLLRRCLEKDPKRRLRDIGDAMLLVEMASEAAPQAGPAASRRSLWAALAAAAVLLVAGGILAALWLRTPAPELRTLRLRMTLPPGLSFTQGSSFVLSPDGRHLAFPAVGTDGVARLWVHSFDALEPRAIEGSQLSASNPGPVTWSPDGRALLFVQDRRLKRIDIDGGAPPQTIVDLSNIPSGASWHRNGMVLLGSGAGITAVDTATGVTRQVTALDESRKETTHLFPVFLPDGNMFLYSRGGMLGSRGIYLGSLALEPEEQPSEPLVTTDVNAAFVPARDNSDEGWLLYVRDGLLLAQRFNPGDSQPRLVGDPQAIAEQVFYTASPNGGFAFFSASDQGTLVYRTGTLATNFARQLEFFTRDGRPAGLVSDPARHLQLKVSPDGKRMVSSRTDLETGSNADLWITDLDSGASTRFTFGGGAHVQPTWSPDGKQIAWVNVRQAAPAPARGGATPAARGDTPAASPVPTAGIYRKSADGTGREELLYEFTGAVGAISVSDWSSDGRYIVFARGGDIFALPVAAGPGGTRTPIPVIDSPAFEFGPDLSPDSRWIAYISSETGRQELYVQPFAPGVSDGTPSTGKWMVSSRGTLGLARWRGDGKELLFVSADGTLMSIDVTSTPVFQATAPRALFQLPRGFLAQTTNPGTLADMTQDGQRLLLAMPSESNTRPDLNVVINWMP